MGLETEYGMAVDPTVPLDVHHDVVRALVSATPGPVVNRFLANGGRLYVDCGHVEYATCEGDDPLGIVVADRAGEAVVGGLPARCTGELAALGVSGVRMLKHGIDATGTPFGCHENYQLPAGVDRLGTAAAVASYLVTRCVWSGAGRVVGGRFVTSQRAGSVEVVVSYNSTVERPLVNLREEPLADADRWQRFHVLAGEPVMGDVPAFTKLAATSMVLRCVALGERPAGVPGVRDVDRVHLAVAGDLTGRVAVPWRDDRRCSPLEVQWAWLECCTEVLGREGLRPWEESGLHWWRTMLERLEADGAHGLVGVADWATKYALLDRLAGRCKSGWDDDRVRYADICWHDVDPVVGLARMLESRGALERLTDPAAVEAAVDRPPCGGRARVRGRFVELTAGIGLAAHASWDRVGINGYGSRLLADPGDGDVAGMDRWTRARLAARAAGGAPGDRAEGPTPEVRP